MRTHRPRNQAGGTRTCTNIGKGRRPGRPDRGMTGEPEVVVTAKIEKEPPVRRKHAAGVHRIARDQGAAEVGLVEEAQSLLKEVLERAELHVTLRLNPGREPQFQRFRARYDIKG